MQRKQLFYYKTFQNTGQRPSKSTQKLALKIEKLLSHPVELPRHNHLNFKKKTEEDSFVSTENPSLVVTGRSAIMSRPSVLRAVSSFVYPRTMSDARNTSNPGRLSQVRSSEQLRISSTNSYEQFDTARTKLAHPK